MVINTDGKVGIGTTSPESQLTIDHGSNTIGSETNAVTAASKAALTITGSGGIIGQISMDNNEIHHFGQDLFIQSQGDTSGEGNIKFRTGVSGKSDRMILTGGEISCLADGSGDVICIGSMSSQWSDEIEEMNET